jgi:hypothetical protein
MADVQVSAPLFRASFLVRDKDGRPKFDRPLREYPEWAQEAFRADMTEAEIAEHFA